MAILISAVIGLINSGAGPAVAATNYWDGGTTNISANGDGASAGGNGTWSTAINNWDTGVAPHVAWNNNGADSACFGGSNSSYTVTLGVPITVSGDMILNASGGDQSFSGSTLTLAGTGGTNGTPLITWRGNGMIYSILSGTNGFNFTGSGNPNLQNTTNTISGSGYVGGSCKLMLARAGCLGTMTNITTYGSGWVSEEGDIVVNSTWNTALVLGGNSSIAFRMDGVAGGTNTWAGNISFSANRAFYIGNTRTNKITGTISGGTNSLSLYNVTAPGGLILAPAGTNAWGATTINAGLTVIAGYPSDQIMGLKKA